MSDERVKEIALGIFRGKLFTSLQLPKLDSDMTRMVFMPLIFMDEKARKKFVADKPVLLWGDLKDTFGRSINGCPMFHTFGYANKADAERIMAKVKEIKSAVEGVK